MGTWDVARLAVPLSEATSPSVANQHQAPVRLFFLTVSLRQPAAIARPVGGPDLWLVIDIRRLKRSVRVRSRSVGPFAPVWYLTSVSLLCAIMDWSLSGNCASLIKPLRASECELGSIRLDGHPVVLTHVHLRGLNENCMAFLHTPITTAKWISQCVCGWGCAHEYLTYLFGCLVFYWRRTPSPKNQH